MGLYYLYIRPGEKCWMAGHIFSDLMVDVSRGVFKNHYNSNTVLLKFQYYNVGPVAQSV